MKIGHILITQNQNAKVKSQNNIRLQNVFVWRKKKVLLFSMMTYHDIKKFFSEHQSNVIIAADAETIIHRKNPQGQIVEEIPAGGVSVAFEQLAKASNATYIARGKTPEDKQVVDKSGKFFVDSKENGYTLKRLFFEEKLFENYYYGFSNQTLWPLCHAAFEKPSFETSWYHSFVEVNKRFAHAIDQEIKGDTFVWINDYQLALVPKFLSKDKHATVGMFWHIPWPTWEIFRILPQENDILESMLACDFIGFHRGYHVRNFFGTIDRALEVRIDQETNKVYYNNHVTTVANLPLGIDTQGVADLIDAEILEQPPNDLFRHNKVMLGIDRLDYTKGLLLRLHALDIFFEKHPEYREKVAYYGIVVPSRQAITSYDTLAKDIEQLANEINQKYQTKTWKPITIQFQLLTRKQLTQLYLHASVCLVTPLDDGMNLVSKEFVVAASFAENPGMLVLSQFAGSAIDLTEALIVNPYAIDMVVDAIQKGLNMPKREKKERIQSMKETLDERNIFEWAKDFVRTSLMAGKDNKKIS